MRLNYNKTYRFNGSAVEWFLKRIDFDGNARDEFFLFQNLLIEDIEHEYEQELEADGYYDELIKCGGCGKEMFESETEDGNRCKPCWENDVD